MKAPGRKPEISGQKIAHPEESTLHYTLGQVAQGYIMHDSFMNAGAVPWCLSFLLLLLSPSLSLSLKFKKRYFVKSGRMMLDSLSPGTKMYAYIHAYIHAHMYWGAMGNT